MLITLYKYRQHKVCFLCKIKLGHCTAAKVWAGSLFSLNYMWQLKVEPVCTCTCSSYRYNWKAKNNLILLPSERTRSTNTHKHTNSEDESGTFYTLLWLYLTGHKLTMRFLYLVWSLAKCSHGLHVSLTFFTTCRWLRFGLWISHACSHTRTHAQVINVRPPLKHLKPYRLLRG